MTSLPTLRRQLAEAEAKVTRTSEARGDALVKAVQARGNDARDPRDAAHEACHAIEWNVRRRWTRDNIHARKPKGPAYGVASEILARAVEAVVCADLGVKYDLDHWTMMCFMETLKNERIQLPGFDWLKAAIESRIKRSSTREMADRVLELADAKPKTKRGRCASL